jgi:hypothetical protein
MGLRNRRADKAGLAEIPNLGALTPAVGDNPCHKFVEIGIGNANMKDAGPPILKIVAQLCNSRL